MSFDNKFEFLSKVTSYVYKPSSFSDTCWQECNEVKTGKWEASSFGWCDGHAT